MRSCLEPLSFERSVPTANHSGKIDFDAGIDREPRHGGDRLLRLGTYGWPVRRHQNDDCGATRQVLLAPEILVCGHDSRKSCCLSALEQVAILQRLPAHLTSGADLVLGKNATQGGLACPDQTESSRQSALRRLETSLGEFKHRHDLFARNSRKPFQEFIGGRAAFEIFEESFDWDA